jgi:hypothetical protein
MPIQIAEQTGIKYTYVKHIIYNGVCRQDAPKAKRRPDYRPRKVASKPPEPVRQSSTDLIAGTVQKIMLSWRKAA